MPMVDSDVTGVILVGGKSRRMGRDKAFLEIDGKTMFDKIFSVFSENFSRILLIGDREERFANYHVPTYADLFPGSSLGGLYTGLFYAETNYIFVSSCDLPYPSSKVISHICPLVGDSDAVVPKLAHGYEPLFAAYAKSCLVPIKSMLEVGNYCVYDLYPLITVKDVGEEDLKSVVESPYSFINLNTPAEYDAEKGKYYE
ncbi:MAG: molybdenum cofactor guanylyltransferase [Desulfuromonadaceae bacterium]|nr:molybdenum cofactor guanylyltransferase [Desulfuromonadaceae bacterium]